MMNRRLHLAFALFFCLALPALAGADFDPTLHQRADDYNQWLPEWHHGDLGGLTTAVAFTDTNYDELAAVHYQGDSLIWTGMYLGSQAIRYLITGEQQAHDEIETIVTYMHNAMDMTDTLGYMPRWAGHDEWPWNASFPDEHSWKVKGVGEWEGYFWVCQTSRDQYSGYIWGMAWAYDALQNETLKQWIRDDLADVAEMLETNQWHITDHNGQWTGNNAHWVGPLMRIAWLANIAHVLDEPYYWELLETQYQINKPFLAIDANSFINKYSEYYGNNLRHLAFQAIFRLWPDRAELEDLWNVWMKQNRPWVKNTNNPWFDAVHVTGCLRLGVCDEDELADIEEDTSRTLGLYWDVPNAKPEITCSDMELDPFSVFMNDLLNEVPWLRELIDIKPQTKDPRELNDRHWTDMYWQSHGVFEASCYHAAEPLFVGCGFDYLVAYYVSVYYGILPGDGPYGDDDFPDDDDTTDDDTVDDDTADDDVADDDAVDDDAADDDAIDDDAVDDDAADDDVTTDDDDDNDDDGCGC